MKKLFYIGCLGLLLFEAANVYFIMPMPGSQQMNSIDLAYYLFNWRWIFRTLFVLVLLTGLLNTQWKRKWTVAIPLLVVAAAIYILNFVMAADGMFKQPASIVMANQKENKVDTGRLIVGVVDGTTAKAYPIRFLAYHHFVYDSINGKPLLITYCTVCRTGRVFNPAVNGQVEKFRLVGMDHFNAMIEDQTTHSWWRQATGKAIVGPLKGSQLEEVHSTQTSLAQWLELYPESLIMQEDPNSVSKYDTSLKYESGASKSKLTGTDSLSWKNKSWVVGISKAGEDTAIDWNELKKKRIILTKVGRLPAFVVLGKDNKSFFAFEYNSSSVPQFSNDTIYVNNKKYKLNGVGIDTVGSLSALNAYQEFWHSWREFHQ